MGTVDIVTKEYMRENAIFADAFNYLIYGGKKVIDPAGLTEIDTATSAVGKKDALQKYRDVLKAAVIKQDEKMSYVLLGVENQTDVHYAMPVRNAIYDALQWKTSVRYSGRAPTEPKRLFRKNRWRIFIGIFKGRSH